MIDSVSYYLYNGRIYANIGGEGIKGEAVPIKPSENSDYAFTKYIQGGTEIDLTPYAKSHINALGILDLWNIEPNTLVDGSEFDFCARPVVDVEVLGAGYPLLYYRGVKETPEQSVELLTRLPYLQVANRDGKYDLLLAFHLTDDAKGEIDFNGVATTISPLDNETIGFIKATNENLGDEYYGDGGSLDVYSELDDTRRSIPLRVIPRGMNTRRLVWLNEVGGVDSWYFEFVRESVFSAASDVFYSAEGYQRTNRTAERTHVVETRELDDLTAEVVSYVIASPEVYLEDEDGRLIPIDIVTTECRTYSDAELSSIQVGYRLKQRVQ